MTKDEIVNKYKYVKNIYDVMGMIIIKLNIEVDYKEDRYRLDIDYMDANITSINEIDNLLGITLKDLTEACYRLKTFKYNYKDEVITNLRLIEESYDSYVVKLVFKRD
jgi:hypothetical protein